VVCGLSSFVNDKGLGGPPALAAGVIEAYCLIGLADRRS